jgi:membrane protein implicated in regulation of membrane protease activity
VVLRRSLLRWLKPPGGVPDVDSLVGELAVPLEDIAAGMVGRVECRGSMWSARNAGDAGLARGTRCTVVRVQGLMLLIREEGAYS